MATAIEAWLSCSGGLWHPLASVAGRAKRSRGKEEREQTETDRQTEKARGMC